MNHPPPRNFCNATFVPEGKKIVDDETGRPISNKLLRCSRCRGAYYIDKEAQQSHWPIHKRFCRPASEFQDLKRSISSSSSMEVANLFLSTLNNQRRSHFVPETAHTGYLFLWGLQRLEYLAKHEKDSSDYSEELGILIDAFQFASNGDVQRLWAVPGMTNYLLNLDLRSEIAKRFIYEDSDAIDDDLLFRPSFQVLQACDSRQSFHIGESFCAVATSLIAFSAFNDVEEAMNPQIRSSLAVSKAAARKCMQWISDPWSLSSIPRRARHSKFIMLFSMLAQRLPQDVMPGDDDTTNEIVPGLTVESSLIAFLNILAADNDIMRPEPLMRLLEDLWRTRTAKPEAWKAFSVKRRAEVAVFIAEVIEGDDLGLKDNLKDCARHAMGVAMGWQRDMALWLETVKEAKSYEAKSYEDAGVFFAMWYDNVIEPLRPSVCAAAEAVLNESLPEEIELNICEYMLF